MTRQYSVLNRKTIWIAVFCAALFAGLAVPASPSLAQDDPYTVSGVRVDATAANAVDARKQAFEQAQQAAFSLLASRFLSQEQMKNFKAPPVEQITPLVDDFEITNEKLSSTRYVGTYTFRFRRGPAQNLINARGQTANEAAYAAGAPSQYSGAYNGAPAHAVNNNYDGVYTPGGAYAPNNAYAPSAAYPAAAGEPAPTGNIFRIRVHFTSIAEWTQTQKTLRGVAGVTGLRIASLTPAEAMVDLRFQGTEAALRMALSRENLAIRMAGDATAPQSYNQAYNPYAAALNATAPTAGDAVYDLIVAPAPASPVLPFPANPPAAAYGSQTYR
jgi:hypothetical protein